jgi:uncharacterized membrane protein
MNYKTNVGVTSLILMGLVSTFGGAVGMVVAYISCPTLTFLMIPYAAPARACFVMGLILLIVGSIVGKTVVTKEKEDTENKSKELLDSIDEV